MIELPAVPSQTVLLAPPRPAGMTVASSRTNPIPASNWPTLKTMLPSVRRPPANGRWMSLSLVVETGDSVRDGAFESVGIGEGAIGELMLLEVAPTSLDVIQFGGVFRQPFEGEPGALGERPCCQLAGVDWPVVEHRHQGPGSFGGAVGGAELVEQGNKVGGALGGAGMHEKAAGAPDQRRRASPAFSPGRALGCATRCRAGPSSAPDRDA